MRVRPGTIQIAALSILSTLTVLGLMGCGTEGSRSGSAPLAPQAQTARAGTADPNATPIAIPFDRLNFVNGVQNAYFPLIPGAVYSYRQETRDGVETNEIEVTSETKVILGVTTFVVHDRVFLEGALKEDTFDWYAPDKDGNVWYFGEDTRELGPPVSTTGSWEAGKNGAQAGIIMLAHPMIGDTYYQENAPGVVADQARVKGLNETAATPFRTFVGCVKTQEWTPIEPGTRAFKFYAANVGPVLEVPNQGGGPVELTAFSKP